MSSSVEGGQGPPQSAQTEDDRPLPAKHSPSDALVRYSSYSPFLMIRDVLERFEFAAPRVDIWHDGDYLFIQVDLPGVSPEDIDVLIDEYSLTVEGERRDRRERLSERGSGRFERVIPLPQHVDTNEAEAQFENGVLEIKVRAIAPRPRGRKLPITVVRDNQPQPTTH